MIICLWRFVALHHHKNFLVQQTSQAWSSFHANKEVMQVQSAVIHNFARQTRNKKIIGTSLHSSRWCALGASYSSSVIAQAKYLCASSSNPFLLLSWSCSVFLRSLKYEAPRVSCSEWDSKWWSRFRNEDILPCTDSCRRKLISWVVWWYEMSKKWADYMESKTT